LHSPAPRVDRAGRKAIQSNPGGRSRLALLAGLGLLLGAGPGAAGDTDAPLEWGAREIERAERLETALAQSQAASLAADTLQVRLAFDSAADLDLYVTDPMQETVYFGNTPARSGGRLEADRRCDHPSPRIETVVFAGAPPGRYRVGIDHPRPCEASEGRVDEGTAVFVLEIRHAGRVRRQLGLSAPLRFVPVVLEFDVEAAAAGDARGNVTVPPTPVPPR